MVILKYYITLFLFLGVIQYFNLFNMPIIFVHLLQIYQNVFSSLGVYPWLKGLRNIAGQHDMCKNIIYNYTLLVTNIRLFIRQTKKHTLFNAQIYQINHCNSPSSASKYWFESLLSSPCKISSLLDFCDN